MRELGSSQSVWPACASRPHALVRIAKHGLEGVAFNYDRNAPVWIPVPGMASGIQDHATHGSRSAAKEFFVSHWCGGAGRLAGSQYTIANIEICGLKPATASPISIFWSWERMVVFGCTLLGMPPSIAVQPMTLKPRGVWLPAGTRS